MKHSFFKRDLHTGDIIETRKGERGIVILEKNCIVYQAGGLDEMYVFTDDLFVDGPQREGDIFKVYHDPDGPLGLNKLFGLDPVFTRKNDRATRARSEELSQRYARAKQEIRTVIFEPCFRRCHETNLDLLPDLNLDMALSEAPSMTACGKIPLDRTFVPVPHADRLFFLYNRHQEQWHLEQEKRHQEFCSSTTTPTPIVLIPELDIEIHSRCMLVRMTESGQLTNLENSDLDRARVYLNQMQ